MFAERFRQWQADTQTFIEMVSSIPEPLRKQAGVCGEWSSQQVIAHLAGWQREALRRFEAFKSGSAPDADYDIDRFNADSVAALSLLNWRETLETYRYTCEDLSAFVQSLTPEQIAAEDRFQEWLEGLAEDVRDHTAEIQNWLERQS